MNFHAGGDFGGFTVTSSRIPEGYDVQHLSSVVISKGIAKDFKRNVESSLSRNGSEKLRGKFAVSGHGLSRTSSVNGNNSKTEPSIITPEPPALSASNSTTPTLPSESMDKKGEATSIADTIAETERKVSITNNDGKEESPREEKGVKKEGTTQVPLSTLTSSTVTTDTTTTSMSKLESTATSKVSKPISTKLTPQVAKFGKRWKKVVAATKTMQTSEDSSNSLETPKTQSANVTTIDGVAAAKTIAKTLKSATADTAVRPAGNANTTRKKAIKPKMDLAKALSLMGFSTARNLDAMDARKELNGALTRKMNDYEQKRKKLFEKDGKNGKFVATETLNTTADKIRDDVRTLHEAYQFLARKYIRDGQRQNILRQNKSVADIDTLDLEDDLHLANNFSNEKEENEEDGVFSNKKLRDVENFRTKAERKKTM